MGNVKVISLREFINQHPTALKQLLHQRENIICRSKSSGKIKRVQLRALFQNNPTFWEHEETWQYYLERSVADAVTETIKTVHKDGIEELRPADHDKEVAPSDNQAEHVSSVGAAEPAQEESLGNFGDVFERYRTMKQEERVDQLQLTSRKLIELSQAEELEPEELAEALIDASESATMTNRAALLEALRLGNDQAAAYTREIVKETQKIVKSTIQLVDTEIYDDDLVRAIVERSNGTVVQHMTRVFLSGLEFLLYYNKQVMTKGIANRIRIRFARDYKEYYHALLPHLHDDYVTLEHVFYGGMKALTDMELHKFATGFLVHDVGKADDIEYHEGCAGYDRKTVERHVKLGYKAVMEKTNYPREAGLITGYHHEYYGHPSGYGYFREFLDAYKKNNPSATQDYMMSYTMEPLIDYQVLAYFPAKMLEIVDVFDSLTDPNRQYRSPLSTEEALTMIEQEFVWNNSKIDPILFFLFLEMQEEKAAQA